MCGTGNDTTTQTTNLLNTSGGLFATVGSLGTATQQSVINTLKTNGVPQLFVASGAHYWNDPSTNPTLFGFQTNYLAEGKIFATYIKSAFKGKSVGFLGQGDDFGTDGLQGLENGGVTPQDQTTYSTGDLFGKTKWSTAMTTFQRDKIGVVVLDTIPLATKLALDAAHAIGFKPTFIISGVGSDPQTVNDVNEKGAISLTFFAATSASSDKASAWNAWAAKVLTAESGNTINGVKVDTFTSKSILSGNQLYGVGYAVAFLQALYKETTGGVTPTQSGFVSTLTSGQALTTPAILPLQYSSTNHQGLTGGYLIKITATGTSTGADAAVNSTIYNVNPSTQALTTSKITAGVVPSYLH
jgi:hypothetical protein